MQVAEQKCREEEEEDDHTGVIGVQFQAHENEYGGNKEQPGGSATKRLGRGGGGSVQLRIV